MSAVIQPPLRPEDAAPTLSQQFAEFALAFDLSAVPDHVVEYAKLCIADSIGIGFASHSYAFAGRSVSAIKKLAGTGEHPVIGTNLSLPPRDAALLNGLLIHGLDFDDTHTGAVVHASTSAVPLMLAEATRTKSSGKRALEAFLIALETDARVGIPAKGMFQKVGFHPTGMVGIFGCTVAAGFLNKLNAIQLARAQGVALSMASGSLEFLEDGAWTKRMHPGWAASSAITATALASEDFIAPLNAYEGRYGLYNLYLQNQSTDCSHAGDDLGHQWETTKVAIKPYPVCHFNHACIDSMLELVKKHKLKANDIESITALVHEKQHDVVCLPEAAKRRPQNDYDAKFSLHFAVSAAAIRGRFTLAELEQNTLHDKDILALCDRTTFAHFSQSRYPEFYSGGVIVTTKDGRSLQHFDLINRGADSRALDHDQVKTKFTGNVSRALDATQAERVWHAIQNLDQAEDLNELNASLASGSH